MNPSRGFWRGRRVLLTGHTGFKGGWLALWLARLGAHVTGVALAPNTSPSLFEVANVSAALAANYFVDVRNAGALTEVMHASRPEVVLHLAAQPLVRYSYEKPADTFATNVMGTVDVLEALRGLDTVRVVVFVTTDKVYANREWLWPYREDDALGGHDPYSASKAASEIVIDSYRKSFFSEQGVRVASARAGNVMGGGDWSADRLLPDAVRAWQSGKTLEIRRPDAVRPWQHVLEPIAGYLSLAQALWDETTLPGPYNFGPAPQDAAPVRSIVQMAQAAWGADAHVLWGDGKSGPHEAGLLTLDTAKARTLLGTTPRWSLQKSINRTIGWYRAMQSGADACTLCHADIDVFEAMS